MAAFQRGIGLAQAQEARDPIPREYDTGGLPDSGLQDGGLQDYGFPRHGSGQGG